MQGLVQTLFAIFRWLAGVEPCGGAERTIGSGEMQSHGCVMRNREMLGGPVSFDFKMNGRPILWAFHFHNGFFVKITVKCGALRLSAGAERKVLSKFIRNRDTKIKKPAGWRGKIEGGMGRAHGGHGLSEHI